MANADVEVKMTPSHPGDFIRTEILEELGLSVTRAAEILGVRRATLSDLLNEKSALSPEMALRVEKAFDVGMTCCCGCRPGTTPRRCVRGQTRSESGGTSQPEVRQASDLRRSGLTWGAGDLGDRYL